MWSITYKFTKLMEIMLYVIFVAYTMYLFCTPGYYGLLVLEVCILSLFSFIVVKLLTKKNRSKGLLEHYSGVTYRKRYHNKAYIIILVCCIVNIFAVMFSTLYQQITYKDNAKFAEYMGSMFEDSGFEKIVYKASPIIPNQAKDAYVYVYDLIGEVESLMVEAYDMQKNGYTQEEALELETKVNMMTKSANAKIEEQYVTIPFVSLYLIFDILLYELIRLLKHRSLLERAVIYVSNNN